MRSSSLKYSSVWMLKMARLKTKHGRYSGTVYSSRNSSWKTYLQAEEGERGPNLRASKKDPFPFALKFNFCH